MEAIKNILLKKIIGILSAKYGEPRGVVNHLKKITQKFPILKEILRKDIEREENVAKEWEHELYMQHLINEAEYRERAQNKCYGCDFGNGEGGCTIPGYCMTS